MCVILQLIQFATIETGWSLQGSERDEGTIANFALCMRHWLDGLFVTHSKFAKKNLHFFFSAVQFLRISFSKTTDNLENVKRSQIG